jgi:hypothetical protein
MPSFVRHSLLILSLTALLIAPAHAQNAGAEFKPQVGQAGKDVIWVPTPNELVSQMLAMAGVTARDTVIAALARAVWPSRPSCSPRPRRRSTFSTPRPTA